jgi:hypothetical protein
MKTYLATTYKGKPAILDTHTRVYYFGFKTMTAAQSRAQQLNTGS